MNRRVPPWGSSTGFPPPVAANATAASNHQVDSLRLEKATTASRIAAVEAERARVDAEAGRKMKELTRGVLMYKCLGLEFEVLSAVANGRLASLQLSLPPPLAPPFLAPPVVVIYPSKSKSPQRANEDWLCVRFTQIDPTDHNREFIFWIRCSPGIFL